MRKPRSAKLAMASSRKAMQLHPFSAGVGVLPAGLQVVVEAVVEDAFADPPEAAELPQASPEARTASAVSRARRSYT
jgi:hypothetical protein